jgi:hypothetical protein
VLFVESIAMRCYNITTDRCVPGSIHRATADAISGTQPTGPLE